ncbi:hypothetical protein Bca52824_030484 [Brassica carinata]|uniref:Glycine-rich protein n=1 Tax=Brassica carinata TaxID=52824 RepID=A0A8X7S988_BRACI|nr:hypothetical protein Bca52824_030484 [Brassica carinata]
MASSKFLVVLALFFTCLSLISAGYRNKPWEQNEMVNPNGATDTDAKEPGQWGGGYVGWCRHGCCYTGRNGCIQCCRYANEQINSVGMQKRGRGQVEEKSSKEEKASPVWTQGRP